MTFIKRQEDFTCAHCGAPVQGSGYTNHCPQCLWSKHVDIQPGDRAERCGGMMRPVGIEGSSPMYTIIHECESCGMRRRVHSAPQDDPAQLVALARRMADSS